MRNIDRAFTGSALGWLVLGTAFGFWMGASGNMQYLGVHVTMLVPGFLTLAAYGTIYRLWPELKDHSLSRAQFWIASGALLAMVIGSGYMAATGSVAIIAPASLFGILGAILMGVIFWRGTAPAA